MSVRQWLIPNGAMKMIRAIICSEFRVNYGTGVRISLEMQQRRCVPSLNK